MANSTKWLIALLLIPCWVIGWLYEVDIRTAYSVISRISTQLLTVYGPPRSPELGRYFYPPFTLVLFAPLSQLPFLPFKIVWLSIQTFSYFVFWLCLVRLYPTAMRSPLRSFLIFVITINPLHNNFQSNNIQIWLSALLLMAELSSRSADTRIQFISGFLVSLTVHIKVYPLFLAAYYFISGRNSVRAGIACSMTFFTLLPFLFFGSDSGIELYRDFITNITSYGNENPLTGVADILCLPSLIARTIPNVYLASSLTKTSAVFLSVAFFLWTWKRQSHPWELAWLLMALLNPSTRVHYFIFFVPAFCLWVERVNFSDWKQSIPLFASLALIALCVEAMVGKQLNNQLELWNLPTWGVLILALGTLRSQSVTPSRSY